MTLKPDYLAPTNLSPTNPVKEALALAGLGATDTSEIKQDQSRVKKALDDNGASLDNIAQAIGLSLRDDDTRIQAAKLGAQLHGVLNEKQNAKEMPTVNINIVSSSSNEAGSTGSNRSFLNFISPRPSQSQELVEA